MRLGFTGTQRGMTPDQRNATRKLLEKIKARFPQIYLHHGDCIGADAQMHDLFSEVMGDGGKVIIHPPTDARKRAFKASDWERTPKPYLDRNRDIVDESNGVIATPAEFENQLRSGTWSTVRYAVKIERKVSLVLPDGSVRRLWLGE